MTPIQIALTLFVVLETLNVVILYFFPKTTKGNGLGVFKAVDNLDQASGLLVSYLTNWVAGTKVIFIGLILVVLVFASNQVQLYTSVFLIPAIATFYWRLYPLAKEMDDKDLLQPKGYSKTLGLMIGVILIVLAGAIGLTVL